MQSPALFEAYRDYLEQMYSDTRDIESCPILYPWDEGFSDLAATEWTRRGTYLLDEGLISDD